MFGMVEAGQHLDLAHEPAGEFAAACQIREHDLHGFDAVGKDIPHLVHLAHAAVAQLPDDFVIAYALGCVVTHDHAP